MYVDEVRDEWQAVVNMVIVQIRPRWKEVTVPLP